MSVITGRTNFKSSRGGIFAGKKIMKMSGSSRRNRLAPAILVGALAAQPKIFPNHPTSGFMRISSRGYRHAKSSPVGTTLDCSSGSSAIAVTSQGRAHLRHVERCTHSFCTK
jgi:hypothetical protein